MGNGMVTGLGVGKGLVGVLGISEDTTVTPKLTFVWSWTQASKPVVLKVWPPDQQHQHYL